MRKRQLNDLAVFGGAPAFAEPLHVGRPHLGERAGFDRRLDDIWNRRWLTNGGPYEQEFERRLEEFLGVRHCIATCNGTVALEILLRALDLHGEVLLPAFTFIATAHAVEWQRLTPVFCDIDAATHNIDPADAERKMTSRTTAIIAVHVWGRPAPIDALTTLATRHRLRLILDAAHAFGCTHRGRPIGGSGDAEVFSFHATKVLNTFEGGAITTNDDGLAETLRRTRTFGFTGYDRVESIGTNGKMTEVAAAMGLTSLESFDRFVAKNRADYTNYQRCLSSVPGVSLVPYDDREHGNYQYLALEIDEHTAGISRDDLWTTLLAENILARRYFFPGCHRMPPYAGRTPPIDLPNTDRLSSRILCLPSGAELRAEDIEEVVGVRGFVVGHGSAVAGRLHAGSNTAD